jgi:TPR repeat protein
MVDSIVGEFTLMEKVRSFAPGTATPRADSPQPNPGSLENKHRDSEQAAVETLTATVKLSRPANDGPRMQSAADLTAFLDGLGLDATLAIGRSRAWFDQLGFLGPTELYGRDAKSSPPQRYQDYDDATLLALAGPGDLGALHTLAAKSAESDPAEAYSWYRQAASYGSVNAMIKIGFLLNRWNQLGLRFGSDPGDRDKAEALLESIVDAEELGLTWIIAAARIGGLPVLRSYDVIVLLQTPVPGAGSEIIETACRQSAKLMLKLAGERRARGQVIFTRQPPPVFIGELNLNELLPCQEQVAPIVNTSSCAAQPVMHRPDWPATLWVCLNP